MSKSASWVVLPSAALGSLSFGINSAGLAPGTYNATVTASANGYASAKLSISLTVTAPKVLTFSTTGLSYSVVQNGTAAKKSAALSAKSGTPAVTLSKSASWVVLPSSALGSLSFGINSAGLAPGTYNATVTASANGYASATLKLSLTVTSRPSVVSVNPANGAVNVSENTSISTSILKLPNGGINNSTITSGSVYLTENATGALVPSHVNGTGGGDAITLVPASSLKLNTTYKFNITSGVKDLSGASFIPYFSTFTTKSAPTTDNNSTIKFSKINLPNATGRHSSLTIGPDGKLYALTIDGIIKRFSMNADGTLGTPQLLYSLQDAYGTRKQRLAIGFAFDPSATATNLIAWVTHSTYVFLNGPDWNGKLYQTEWQQPAERSGCIN
ncbi:MAG: Ig-like domain-containing protein [Segetibacter sp.]